MGTSWLVVLVASACPAAVRPVSLPLSFEPNLGQSAPAVKYLAHGPSAMLWLTSKGPVLGLDRKSGLVTLTMRFVGGNPVPRITAEDRRNGESNYFIGNDSGKWRKNVPQFGKIRYSNVYPGI